MCASPTLPSPAVFHFLPLFAAIFPMKLETSTRELPSGITVVELKGRLTLGDSLTTAEDAIKKLAATKRKIILDLSQADFIDSAGLGMLVACSATATSAGGQLRVSGALPRVQQIFLMTQVYRVIPLYATIEAATESFT